LIIENNKPFGGHMEKITVTIVDYFPDRVFYTRGNNKKVFQYINTGVYQFIERYRRPWTKNLVGKKFKIPVDQDFGYLIQKNEKCQERLN